MKLGGWPLRLLVVVAYLALMSGGGIAGKVAAACVLSVVAGRPWPRIRWTAAHVVVIGVSLAIGATFGSVDGVGVLVAWLLAHRHGTGTTRGDVLLTVLLSTAVLLLACVTSISVALAGVMVAVAGLAPAVLLRVQGVHSPPLERSVGVATALLGGLLFLVLPRLQSSVLTGGRESGVSFPDEVTLDHAEDRGDGAEVVLRLRVADRAGEPVSGPFYVRGRALDTFDGTRWTATQASPRTTRTTDWGLRADVLLEPLSSDALFTLGEPLSVTGLTGGGYRDAGGNWHHRMPGHRLAYTVYARETTLGELRRPLEDDLELPPLDPRVQAIAARLAPGGGPLQIIAAALAYLGDGFTYTAVPPSPPAGDPLVWFLTESRTGHCEYYASALAVLLRARGVPARLATGFYAAEPPDVSGYVTVRRASAHAWVEVPVKGGWAALDASPSQEILPPEPSAFRRLADAVDTAWLRVVLDYDFDAQIEELVHLGTGFATEVPGDPIRTRSRQGAVGFAMVGGVVVSAGVLVRGLLLFLGRRNAAPTAGAMLRSVRAGRRLAERRGWSIPRELPAVEAGEWLVRQAGEAGRPLLDLAWLHYRTRYAEEVLPEAEAEGRRLLGALRALPRRRG